MSSAAATVKAKSLIQTLQSIQIGGSKQPKIRPKDLVRIMQSLATLLENGVSLSSSLDAIQSDRNFKGSREILLHLSQSVNTGGSLSSAMKKYPATFPSLIVHQVEIGESTGELNRSLSRLVSQLENRSALRSFLIKKLTYPCLLLSAGFGCVVFMLTSVIPTFQKMYQDSGAVLPWITQVMIDISDAIMTRGPTMALSILVIVGGAIFAHCHPRIGVGIDRLLLRLPMFGPWLNNIAILQFSETLSNLLNSGFILVEALPGAARSVTNRYIRQRLNNIHAAVRRGERFSGAINKEQDVFPPVVKQLVVVGERTGRLAEVSRQIQQHLKNDVEKLTSTLLGAIEPLLTVGLAVVIGGILLAVYLPMFDMIGQTSE